MKNIAYQHLFLRAGFGANPAEVQEASKHPIRKIVRRLLEDSEQNLSLHTVDPQQVGYTRRALLEMVMQRDSLSPEQKKQMSQDIQKEYRDQIGDLNYAWVSQMGSGKSALREKMTFFWHGHFACRSQNPNFVQLQNNTIREKALGKFGDLLLAISKDPAMLQFLNNQQNRKQSPNENFAREVMELFTLGRGHYTEQDIKEAARAFTGWGFNLSGEFTFRKNQHDEASKTFFGKTGNFNGEDILTMILERPETATFLVTKLYRFFVNDTPDQAIIAQLAPRFQQKDYDIAWLLEEIFTSDWFYAPQNIGIKIKSPVEYIAGLQRTFGLKYGNKQSVLYVQKALDQVLFYPPNVAGWPGGTSWIDSSSLLLRMKLPEVILNSVELNFKAKADGDVNTAYLTKKSGRQFQEAELDWPAFGKPFEGLTGTALIDALAGYLIQRPLNEVQRALILKRKKKSELQDYTLAILTLPEYQLC
ncbi:MAG: DUF1800 domain-containing protein [Siphonobacter sp.]